MPNQATEYHYWSEWDGFKVSFSHGFPQCLGAVDGRHVNIKKAETNTKDYMNRKGPYSFNVQAAADYQYCFLAW